ncbi:hypothetical protein EQZ09_00635 [Clostridium perfringens]|uniref:hypothetical protein n=1 Tax=Clostridium perfringens TaxID=1502 RepID=UPI000F523F24|nr:hypothetical protein [Clostridium perfringens]EGT4136352.1 hypothetical protein [Clostridium perfringens]
MNLICDTNIWYNIINKNIDIEDLEKKGYNLIANPINFIEIMSNEKYNHDTRVEIIDCMLKYSENFIKELPDEYLMNIWNVNNIRKIDWEKVLIKYKTKEVDFKNDISLKNNYYNAFSQEVTSVITRFLPEYESKRKAGRAIHMKKVELENLKKNTTYIVFETLLSTFVRAKSNIINNKEVTDESLKISYQKIFEKYNEFMKIEKGDIYKFIQYICQEDSLRATKAYEKLKVYCNAYPYYIFETLSKKLNEPNDLGDLELLIYVNDNNKLFTKEKKWKNIMVNAGLENYLFIE